MPDLVAHTQIDSIKPRLLELIEELPEEYCRTLFQKVQATMPKDLREHPRVGCFIPVDYTRQGCSFEGFIKDISKGGVFIETRAHQNVGDKIKLTFSSPKRPKPITVTGRIVRENILGVGVEFEKAKEVTVESTWVGCRRNTAETIEERRFAPRVDLQCPAYIEGIREEKSVTDFSLGGFFVECDAISRNKFRIGQLITLNIKLPTEDDLIQVRAQLINYSDRGMHCRFAHLGHRTEYAIHRCFNMAKHAVPIK